MRFITPLLCLSIALISEISAEGTREVAPNGNITILGNPTTDLAALHINHNSYNNFASYSNDDPHSRLYINIQDPSNECIFLGFSFGHFNESLPNPTRKAYQYRIKDPAGNVVFGPVSVPTSGGNIQNWSEAFTGPMQINGAGGYDAVLVTSGDLTSQGWSGEGDYYVEFQAADFADVLIDFWDITVVDCSPSGPLAKTGRVWSYNWSFFAVNDFGFPNRPFNGAFYVCAPDPDDVDRSFITKIDFNGSGFRPAAFNIAFNSFGSMNTGNIAEDRKSVENNNSTQSEYAIFLNDPVELCQTAIVGEIQLHGISRCDAGEYCIKFTASKEGQLELLLDFDGPDDVFTPGTADRLITLDIDTNVIGIPTCISWDGLDGFGNPVPEVAGTTIPITLSYAQGIYHFPIYDAEFMTNGFMLEAVRPAASVPLLHYDDSNISVLSGSGEPVTQISGCMVPCHRWTNFPNANIPGFGNLNTINSWWFSQRIIRQDVLLLPTFYTCEVDGPQSICQGGTTQIISVPQAHPFDTAQPEIVSITWSGPGIIGSNTGENITVGAGGNYQVILVWVTALGDTCSTTCDYQLHVDPPLEETIDTLIVQGDVLVINNEEYTEAGQYFQNLTTAQGCDSILTINVKVIQTVVHYDLEDCYSNTEDASPMDYSEFVPAYPEPLSCADIDASIIYRDPPAMNKHSCTEGVNGGVAMCISSLDTCAYDAGNDASLVFELTITPDPDTAIHVAGISFFERAPITYSWLHGTSGPNNFPTLYGIRVLKDGVEIYRVEDISTSNDWTLQAFDFLDDEDFIIEDPATFTFELLPYCLVANGAVVTAWDVDEIMVTASCAPFEGLNQIISGIVKTLHGIPVPGVDVRLVASGLHNTLTDIEGYYKFGEIPEGSICKLDASKPDSYANGVSTLDLIAIQKHLLGIKAFNSPYQYIAADANRSNAVTVKDMLDLKRLLLGYTDVLPNNTSWRFGNADAANTSLPWGFKESIEIELLKYDYLEADFTGVKIGDLNGDAKVDFGTFGISSRTSNVILLEYTKGYIENGTNNRIDIKAGENMDLSGLQFALDIKNLDNVDIESGILSITPDDYHAFDGELRLSWLNASPVYAAEGEILFTIIYENGKNTGVSERISLLSNSIPAEAYINDGTEVRRISFLPERGTNAKDILFQNEPNPFHQQTTIRFYLYESRYAAIRIMDISGRIIKEISGVFDKGMNSVDISGPDMGEVKGFFFCQLACPDAVQTVKMVRL